MDKLVMKINYIINIIESIIFLFYYFLIRFHRSGVIKEDFSL